MASSVSSPHTISPGQQVLIYQCLWELSSWQSSAICLLIELACIRRGRQCQSTEAGQSAGGPQWSSDGYKQKRKKKKEADMDN